MERLKSIKNQLISQVQAQMGDLKKVDTKELGEVIDMIKDIAQTEYYCKVYDAMEKEEEEESKTNNYYYLSSSRDMDKQYGKMYYPEDEPQYYSSRYGHEPGRSEEYYEREYPLQYLRDEREGRSPVKRKMYMEGKNSGADATKAMKDLESYMQDLTSDMMELLEKASPEEKAMIQRKINTLASKIQNV